MNKWPCLLLTTLGLAATFGAAQAALKAVDPGPYTAATGRYPLWYEDHNGLKLELCRSKATSRGAAGSFMCPFEPEPGIFDPALPMVFPDNWPSELFWLLAEAEIEGTGGYELEKYVAGLEAAFSGDVPVAGDQVSFGRIRLRVSIPTPGLYTITHPYGVETINVTTTGRRAINMTRDIGIAQGNFNGALNSNIGPFLRSADAPLQLNPATGQMERFYAETNPETGEVERFVGDPNLTQRVTGSPFNTNFVRIQGPAGTIQTDLFTLAGKLLDARPSTAVDIERASYRRTSAGTRVEVFASSAANATLCFRDRLALIPGTPPSPCQLNLIGDNNGRFFAHNPGLASPPQLVVVTASTPSGATKPTSTSARLVDVVKVNTARYSWADRSLRIEAVSSDETNVPDLVAQGYGRLSKSGTLQSLTVNGLAQPPAFVTVKSSAGGSDREPVTVVGQAPDQLPNQAPVSLADSATTSAGVPVTINVLANDHDPEGGALSVVDLTPPAAGQGSVALSGNSVVYTPPATVGAPLTATFTYRAQDAEGLKSAVTTVTVNVAATPNQPPLAGNDSAGPVAAGSGPLLINVLANDSDPEGGALTVVALTPPAAGQGTVSTNGTQITYTPPATVTAPFTATFTYRVQDAQGAQSAPATVSVQVNPPAVQETLTVTSASVQARAGGRYTWDLTGTSSRTTGNVITVQVSTASGPVVLGTAPVAANGRWRLAVTGTTPVPTASPTATITSSFGNTQTVNVTVQ
ncbi:Bacterial Ig domain protein [compost metagenome]